MKEALAKRPSGVTLALNGGVPAPEVARRAGHSVDVLLRVYAGCIDEHAEILDRAHRSCTYRRRWQPGAWALTVMRDSRGLVIADVLACSANLAAPSRLMLAASPAACGLRCG